MQPERTIFYGNSQPIADIANKRQAAPMETGKRLALIGGDGDQSWFSGSVELEVVEREWFDPATSCGEGSLVHVVSGQYAGKYVALTSRVQSSIDQQLAERQVASVIVNVVRRSPNFPADVYSLDPVGMGVIGLTS